MKFKILSLLIVLLLYFTNCTESKKVNSGVLNYELESISIHGKLTKEQIEKYYPKLLDTITDIRILGAEKLELNLDNNIIVSLLHNTGTFDEMILCTHNKNFDLIDSYYIGKSTMFDNNSHVINYKFIDHSNIRFTHVNYGYIEQNIDTLSHYSYTLSINNLGIIEKKNNN